MDIKWTWDSRRRPTFINGPELLTGYDYMDSARQSPCQKSREERRSVDQQHMTQSYTVI